MLSRAKLLESVEDVIYKDAALLEVALNCAQTPTLGKVEVVVLIPSGWMEPDVWSFNGKILCDGRVPVSPGRVGCSLVSCPAADFDVGTGRDESTNIGNPI